MPVDATPLLRLYARMRRRSLARQRPAETQEAVLAGLLARAAATRFGRDHGFAQVHGVAEFRRAVPLRRYEGFWLDYWQPAFPRLDDVSWPGPIPYLAVTSGTTSGASKSIPVSPAMVRANLRAGADIFVHHLAARPASRILAGRNFMLGGSISLETLTPRVSSGDLSGIMARVMPWWARLRAFPPRHLEAISDWEEKIAAFAAAVPADDIRAIAGVPSWLLILFDRMAALRPETGGSLARLFPRLELLIHGGVDFRPYRRLFADRLAGSAAETRERFLYLIRNGQTGLNVAFDLPTQIGLDSDDPMAEGEVGRVGMAVDSLDTLKAMTPKFREALKSLNTSLERSGLPKLQDAERQFERIVDSLQAAEFALIQLERLDESYASKRGPAESPA